MGDTAHNLLINLPYKRKINRPLIVLIFLHVRIIIANKW